MEVKEDAYRNQSKTVEVFLFCRKLHRRKAGKEKESEDIEMEKLFNGISIWIGLIGGVFTYWLGGWDILLKTIVLLAVSDYLTGIIKGVYTKSLSSEIGFKGLLKKIVMFIVIAVAFAIQNLLNDSIPLREVVIMFYIANEALSLLENAAMFVPIPEKLRDVLLQLRDKDYTNID